VVTIEPQLKLRGRLQVPGDKSISHRAAIIGALAHGMTEVEGFLRARDPLQTLACLTSLGVRWENRGENRLIIEGRGFDGLREPKVVLDAGNSGTTIRLLMGVLAGTDFFSVLTGDASLRRRPMGRVAEPLKEMGARVFGRAQGQYAPVAIVGSPLRGIEYRLPVASAQVKSALLLAGLRAEGETVVVEPGPSRDHTERMLSAFGAEVDRKGRRVAVRGLARLEGQRIVIPGDISSAAFLMVAACIRPRSDLIIEGVGVNPTRAGVIRALRAMGARIEVENERNFGPEPVADLRVGTSDLHGTKIDPALVPTLIDEIPALAVAACYASGRTVVRGAGELKVKETNRIEALAAELGRMGACITPLPDGLVIEGGRELTGARCSSRGDHRMAMALAVAALGARGPTTIVDGECVDVSFPGFYQAFQGLVRP